MKKRTKTVSLCLAMAFLATFALIEYSKRAQSSVRLVADYSSAQLMIYDVGSHATREDGQRAAIRQFSRLTQTHANIGHFDVYFQDESASNSKRKSYHIYWFINDETMTQSFGDYHLKWSFDRYPFGQLVFNNYDGADFLFNAATVENIRQAARENLSLRQMSQRWDLKTPH